jgi:hypothetical protein
MRKVDISLASDKFIIEVGKLKEYMSFCSEKMAENKLYLTYTYNYGIIALYKIFEQYIYKVIVGCINHDSSEVCRTYCVCFGKHINDDICDFIITKGGYFDFKGRDGLIKILKQNIGGTYGIVDLISSEPYKNNLDKLCSLRNFAAHSSKQAKAKALSITHMSNMDSAGSYLKILNRYNNIADELIQLAIDIKQLIP